jgi:serine/threonine-protein kinase RsbW
MAKEIIQGKGGDLFFIAPSGRGKTALLKEVKDLLFWKEEEIVPVYYNCSRGARDVLSFADSYLISLISQVLLFEKKELFVETKNISLSFSDLQFEAERQGKRMMEEIILNHQRARRSEDEYTGLVNALEAPGKIAQAINKPIWMLLDHFQEIEALTLGERGLGGIWRGVIDSPWSPHLFAGEPPGYLLKTLLPTLHSSHMTVVELAPMPKEESRGLATVLTDYYHIEAAQDLVGMWFEYVEGNPGTITSLFREAATGGNTRLESHQRFCQIYFEALERGELGRGIEHRLFESPEVDPLWGEAVLKILHHLETFSGPMVSLSKLQDALQLSPEKVKPILRLLERAGFIWERFGKIGLEPDQVLRDWIKVQIRKFLFQQDQDRIINELGSELERKLSSLNEGIQEIGSAAENSLHFNLVLPINSESELVAVRALEQIAATYSELDETSIEKAKIALIEACINAGEHSQSFEKKIRVYFTVRPNFLEIVVEDRGQSFDPVAVQARIIQEKDPFTQRRGRGLGLIRELMDEVRFEKAEIGTRLVMVKKLNEKA